MSSHIHCIMTARQGSIGHSAILRDFKKHTSKELLAWILHSNQESRRDWMKAIFAQHATSNKNNKSYQLWQQNNQPKHCIHPKFTAQKIDYIHQNPVEAGLVDNAEDFKHSSARNYLGRTDALFDLKVIDFGVQEGYVFI